MMLLTDDQLRKVDFGSNHYYVFSQKHKRWIDMRHFISSALETSLGLSVEIVMAGGEVVEIGQTLGNSASANGVEDRYSNYYGAVFGERWRIKEANGRCFTLSAALREDFQLMKVGKKSAATSLPLLPKNEEEWDKWRHTSEYFKWMYELEGAMVMPRDKAAVIRGEAPKNTQQPTDGSSGSSVGSSR